MAKLITSALKGRLRSAPNPLIFLALIELFVVSMEVIIYVGVTIAARSTLLRVIAGAATTIWSFSASQARRLWINRATVRRRLGSDKDIEKLRIQNEIQARAKDATWIQILKMNAMGQGALGPGLTRAGQAAAGGGVIGALAWAYFMLRKSNVPALVQVADVVTQPETLRVGSALLSKAAVMAEALPDGVQTKMLNVIEESEARAREANRGTTVRIPSFAEMQTNAKSLQMEVQKLLPGEMHTVPHNELGDPSAMARRAKEDAERAIARAEELAKQRMLEAFEYVSYDPAIRDLNDEISDKLALETAVWLIDNFPEYAELRPNMAEVQQMLNPAYRALSSSDQQIYVARQLVGYYLASDAMEQAISRRTVGGKVDPSLLGPRAFLELTDRFLIETGRIPR